MTECSTTSIIQFSVALLAIFSVTINCVALQEKEILWIPVLTFENTENKPFTLADEKTSITVKKQGEFSLSKVRCWWGIIIQTKYNISYLFLAALPDLYHLRILDTKCDFGDWRPTQTFDQSEKKTKFRKRVWYCGVRAVLHFCDVLFMSLSQYILNQQIMIKTTLKVEDVENQQFFEGKENGMTMSR